MVPSIIHQLHTTNCLGVAIYKQPAMMALSPESRDSTKHQFIMGSRVEFSDPPRYSEIRWMGNFPQVNGLIAGVELVS